ncbi:MAG: hypothetical protein ACRER2_07820, partial [Methylococcales bacterium]
GCQGRAASGGKPPLTTGVRRKKAATMSEWVALLTGFLIEGRVRRACSPTIPSALSSPRAVTRQYRQALHGGLRRAEKST